MTAVSDRADISRSGNVDQRAARGFTRAWHYDAYRPSYPPEAVAFVREAAGLDTASVVVEIGAGSGLMTRLVGPVGRLIAIEPLAEMREVLRVRVPEAEVVDATAEQTHLPSTLADLVIVAQAFHWFATAGAVDEIARVLRPDGMLALVWNVRDSRDPFMESLYAVLAPHRRNSPGHDNTPWKELFEREGSPLALTSQETFSWEESITLGHLKGRVLSTSYVSLLDEEARSALLCRLEGLIGSAADEAPVRMRHHTEVFVARRAAGRRPPAIPRRDQSGD